MTGLLRDEKHSQKMTRVCPGCGGSKWWKPKLCRKCYEASFDPPEVRFHKFYRVAESGCWEWTGSIGTWGYGRFGVRNGHNVFAHRWSYEHAVGPLLDGVEIDHLCRNRRCVNPAHLEQVTHQENQRRIYADRTTCSQGHPFSGVNKSGARICHACGAAKTRRYRERQRAAA